MKILLIEDEPSLLASMQSFLEQDGNIVSSVATFHKAIEKVNDYDYDCLVIDITLPDGNGLEIIRELKKRNTSAGIIIVSAKNSLEDRLTGLDLGADDYLTKPFHLSELNARIKSVLRRRLFDGKTKVVFDVISISPDNQQVSVKDEIVELTGKEYELLLFFISNKNRILSKSVIAEHLWGDSMDLADSHDFIYTHIKNLRKKLIEKGCPDYVKTRYGAGYIFSEKL
ncbi:MULTISPECIES: response regulator transcription factor [unclassified Arcicella]|uniref:response regulator transcription factor n=1 Tax=unclassified Arcicella TaxID=2644986 RepID=UPI00285A4B35|nr:MULTISPECIES: response regulator transcription factor [unclassified Arcicella]MDR6560256.1 DNA-binding response OmpR family regulator [Arcicella sp. BE51]MDR6810138.1 DNA-binding response OmpR family regulator [Arcicella sp. BE140]MDR6821487.1 DNA-binding response OmpR family regulator [Arcicella sp. BE139]